MADVFAGRYELIDPVGSGGNSLVWRAWDRRLGRVCAAKVLRQRHAGALLRFVREQGLRLDHPHVLSPYSWAAEDDQALLAMDLVGGGSVSSLLADFGALPERYAAELLAQLLGALDQVHAAGLVHRDIKPANLLLEATGTGRPVLRLSDFGIALSLGEPRLTQHGAIVGTPGYVAPEALAGQPPSISQDLYAVGVTGWQLLTGEEPPASGPPPSRPSNAADTGVASVLWQVIEGLLQPEAADRTQSAEEALASLAPVLAKPLELPAVTPDGEPIEVFDQLPPLPTAYATRATQPKTPESTALAKTTPHGETAGASQSTESTGPGGSTGPPEAAGVADSVGASGSTGTGGSAGVSRPSGAAAVRGELSKPGGVPSVGDAGMAGFGGAAGVAGTGGASGPAVGDGAGGAIEPDAVSRSGGSAGPGEVPGAGRDTGSGGGGGAGAGTAAGGGAGVGTGTAAGGSAGVGAGGGAGGGVSAGGVAGWRKRWVWAGGVAGVVAVMAVVAAVALDGVPEGKPSGGQSSGPVGGQTSGPPSGGQSSESPSGGQSSGSPGGPSGQPSGGVSPGRTGGVTPAPNAAVKVGGVCGWQEVGDGETAADGTRVVCRQQGASYRWVKA